MANINRIETLIHPDFLLMQKLQNGEPFTHHPQEIELRRKWDEMADNVSKDSASRLVYFTWLSQSEINKASTSGLENPWKNLDYKRMRGYEGTIGERMVVAPLFPRYTVSIVDRIRAGAILTPQTEIYIQGEWTDACVKREGQDLADLLKIDKNRRITVTDNSRFSWEGKILLDWHSAQ